MLDFSDRIIAILVHYILTPLLTQFGSTGTVYSLSSLGCALVIGTTALVLRRRRRGRKVEPRTLIRMLFPRKLTRSPTCGADLFYFFFNLCAVGLLIGWAVLSAKWIAGVEEAALNGAFGPRSPSTLPPILIGAFQTFILFIVYEFGSWFNHYLCHKIPALWEFHKVHHTAELLTPLTVSRFHPVEVFQNGNILALSLGTTNALATWGFGEAPHVFMIDGRTILFVVAMHGWLHLQHSNIWIPFLGVWGRIFMSPAHHQIHHSTDPAHFNRNFGSCLTIFDTLFKTLHLPSREPQRLTYGVEGEGAGAHLPSGLLLAPFQRAFLQLIAAFRSGPTPRKSLPRQANGEIVA